MFQKIEDCLNKKIKCSDGVVRRLNGIAQSHLDYEGLVEIDNDKYWYDYGKISRSIMEKYFLNGTEVLI